jgi:hypothetical protein
MKNETPGTNPALRKTEFDMNSDKIPPPAAESQPPLDSHRSRSERGEVPPHFKRKVWSPRSPFIVDVDASILRKLGKHARALYTALRYMADGKSGELRFRERWYKAKEFDHEAKICERVRLAAMRELVAAGLVTFTRPRVRRMIGGRLRAVAGSVHYVVHRQPVPLKNPPKTRDSSKLHLQNCIPGSLLQRKSQIVTNSLLGARGSVFLDFENGLGNERAQSSSAPGAADDDSRGSQSNFKDNGNGKPNPTPPVEENEIHVKKILDRAAATLKKRGEDPAFVVAALGLIDQRAHEAGTVPASEPYYLSAFANLLNNADDLAEVENIVGGRKAPFKRTGEEQRFVWCHETIAVEICRGMVFPSLSAYYGARAADVVEFLIRRGFAARIVSDAPSFPAS